MALIFVDGFDHYTWGGATAKWTGTWDPQGGRASISSSFARVSGNGLGGTTGNVSWAEYWGASKNLPSSQSTWIIGVAYKWSGGFNSNAGVDNQILGLYDQINGFQCGLFVPQNLGGVPRFKVGSTIVSTAGSVLISPSTWHYLEFKAIIASSGGLLELRVDEQVVQTYNGNTQALGVSTANAFQLNQNIMCQNTTQYYDDLYVCDGTGSINNNYLGDVSIRALFPTAAGTTNNFSQTGGTGGSPYTAVNNATPDDDTSYLSSSTVTNEVTLTFQDVPANTAAVKGVQVNMYARKDDAGGRQIAPVARPTTTDHVGSNAILTTSYQDATAIFETNPDTSSAWSASDVNGAEFGIEVTA